MERMYAQTQASPGKNARTLCMILNCSSHSSVVHQASASRMHIVSPQLDAFRMSGINQGQDKSLSTWRSFRENNLSANITTESCRGGNSFRGTRFQEKQGPRYQRNKALRIDCAIRHVRGGSRVSRAAKARNA